jgi:cell shape-determining protein MreC
MRNFLLIVLTLVLLMVVYWTNFFWKKEYNFSQTLRLQQENEDLRAALQRLSGCKDLKICCVNIQWDKDFVRAKVFSTYPFNVKNRITISVGRKDGIEVGRAATIGENIFVGRVVEVFDEASIVETVFDANLELPVRIGEDEINGVFKGGAVPKVVLLEKPISLGDVVFLASSDFPLNLKIGEVMEIKENNFKKPEAAVVKIPVQISDLREVNIVK